MMKREGAVPITYKTPQEIAAMRKAGRVAAMVLEHLVWRVQPGITTGKLNAIAEEMILDAGAIPTFKGYRGYRHTICASVNAEVVHGIPTNDGKLKKGDILSIDIGATLDGWVGDCAVTVPVGEISEEARKLIDATKGSLDAAIEAMKGGKTLMDISRAIQTYGESRGYGVVRAFCGHGIGRIMHEDPNVLNFVEPSHPHANVELRTGLVLAIEPMLCLGTYETETMADGWTVVTKDRKLSAHFEHTVAMTENGPEILTLS